MSKQTAPENPCARAGELLPEYWQDGLNSGDRAWLARHLQTCADCAGLAALWRELGELPEAKPDPDQRRRFAAMLEAYDPAPSRLPWRKLWRRDWRMWLRPAPAALALVLLLAGLGGGWWLRGLDSLASARHPAPVSASIASPDQAAEIAALREEVRATNQLVVLSMLQQQSANDRLEGVSYSNRLDPLDPAIRQALLHSLQYDPSPDVRLAALDALERAGRGQAAAEVIGELVEAFPYQKSPLVQIALVDSFLELHPPAAQALLQKISTDSTYSPEVRQRAAWGLSHWN